MKSDNREPYAGQTLIEVLEDLDTKKVLCAAEYEVLKPQGLDAAPQMFEVKLLNERWSSADFKAFNAPWAERGPADSALDVAKFAWDFIKDNRAVAVAKDTMTSVLYKGTDPLDYANAVEGRSSKYRFYVHDKTIPSWILIDTSFRLEGSYRARPSKPEIPPGNYLPSIHFNVLDIFVGWSFRLDAHAEVSSVEPLGPPSDVQPQVRIYAKINWSWLSTQTRTCGFVANGLKGFWGAGWEK